MGCERGGVGDVWQWGGGGGGQSGIDDEGEGDEGEKFLLRLQHIIATATCDSMLELVTLLESAVLLSNKKQGAAELA